MKDLFTDLEGRRLRFDGTSVIDPDRLVTALLRGVPPSKLRLTGVDPDVARFNTAVDAPEQLREVDPTEPVNLSFEWLLPKSYLELDVYERVGRAYEALIPELYQRYSQRQYDEALERISVELAEFERRGMVNFLRTIIYVLDVFREKQVVWGVGRGSSCASYILFLLGLHAVDCVWYNVPYTEFFHS